MHREKARIKREKAREKKGHCSESCHFLLLLLMLFTPSMAFKKTPMCINSDVLVVLLLCSLACSVTASVSYDSKAITINGQRRILISGSIHYPRSSPEVFSLMCFVFLLFLKLFLKMGTSNLCSLFLFFLFKARTWFHIMES